MDTNPATDIDERAVLAKAVLRAADHLGLSNRALSHIVGLSPSSLSRMRTGRYRPDPNGKEYELCVHFLRVYRLLDAFVGGDREAARTWLGAPNIGLASLAPEDYRRPRDELKALGRVPVELMTSVQGLLDVAAYLDARRGVV